MQVKVYAMLRPIVGTAVVPVETQPGATIQALVDELVVRWPGLRPEMVNGSGELLNRIHIFINGRSIRFLDNVATVIPENAHVDIFPPVGGG